MRLFWLLVFICFYGHAQYTGPWTSFRVTKVRQNHCEVAWESVAGATSFTIQYKTVPDASGYFDVDATPTGYTNLSVDCVNDTPAGGSATPVVCITDSTAVIYGLNNNTRYRFRIIATGATNTNYNTTYSYQLPVRTGLFPDETTTYDTTAWTATNRDTEPAQGDFSEWTNYFGNVEVKVTDRTRDGNDRGISMGYPKQLRFTRMTDGYEFMRPHEFGTNRLVVRTDDNSYSLKNHFYETYNAPFLQVPGDTIFYDDEGANTAVNTFVKYTDGVGATIYSSSPQISGDGTSGILRSGETRFSWDMRYVAFEVYNSGSSNPYADQPTGVLYDLVDDAIERTFTPPSGFIIGNGQFDVCPKGDHVMFNNDAGSGVGAAIHVYNVSDGSYVGNAEGPTAGGTGSADYMGHADLTISIQGHCGIIGRKGSNIIFIPFEGPNQFEQLNMAAVTSAVRKPEISHIGAQYYLHEGWVLMDNGTNGGHPTSTSDFNRYYNKIWSLQVDESAPARSENALVRFYGVGHVSGTKNVGGNRVVNHYAGGNIDMTKVFANLFTPRGTSTNHAETYAIRRADLHGDEIPLTSGGDVTAPTVVSVTVDNITQTSARIDWSLDEGATGQISYGLTASYGTTSALESNFLDRHIQTLGAGVNLPALSPGTTYHYTITGQDPSSNAISDIDRTFTTLSESITYFVYKNTRFGNARNSAGAVKFIVN